MQIVADLDIALFDHVKDRGTVDVVLHVRLTQIQQVGYLVVVLVGASDRADDDEASGRIAFYDMLHLGKLLCVCQRRTAKFRDLDHPYSPFAGIFAQKASASPVIASR